MGEIACSVDFVEFLGVQWTTELGIVAIFIVAILIWLWRKPQVYKVGK